MNHQVILSLAANRFQTKNLSRARRCLEEILTDVRYTSEHWTQPLGRATRRDVYLNQLASGSTQMDEVSLNTWLKNVEVNFGRNEQKRRLGIIPIDLDILQFDGERRHEKDWERPYVKELIDEL